MEKITILYGSPLWDDVTRHYPNSDWYGEFFALQDTGMFHIAFFNYSDFMRGEKLQVAANEWWAPRSEWDISTEGRYASSLKPKKRENPTILRCPYMDEEHYRMLERELPRFGYRLVIDSWESHNYGMLRHSRGLGTDQYMIESVVAGSSFGSNGYCSLQPTIYLVRDEDCPVDIDRFADFFAMGWITGDVSRRMVDDFTECRGGRPVGEVFFEKYVPYAVAGGTPVAWRVFFFDGIPFHMDLVWGDPGKRKSVPEPPEEVLQAFASQMGSFGSCDLVLEEGGGWKCSRVMDGQFTSQPPGGDDEAYAKAFVKVVSESPHVSESWCLTAYVKDENAIGEDHRIVHGTRHFAPGTKVWLHAPNWDGRVAAIGVPRYSEKLIRVVMDVKKLESFDVEMVRDKEILAGLAYPYRAWPFTKLAPTMVGRGIWNASDECHERILDYIEWLGHSGQDDN